MNNPEKILIIQTAFLGDLILTLPLIEVIKNKFPGVKIDILCIPFTSQILKNDTRINEIITFDKKGSDAGFSGLQKIIKKVKQNNYDLIISPHRSFRTALISFLSGCKKTISFDTSSGSMLYKYKVKYRNDVHEIVRDLSLLKPLESIYNISIDAEKIISPKLFTSAEDKANIEKIFSDNNITDQAKKLVIAPGTVWNTKRYPKEYFAEVCTNLSNTGIKIFLIGGKEDIELSSFIRKKSANENVIDITGKLSITASTELIRRSDLLLTNDSAPLHIGSSEGIKTFAIFGATVPAFGFYPLGSSDKIFETTGLTCRPCSIHGGDKCPIGTFVCMYNIKPSLISSEINKSFS